MFGSTLPVRLPKSRYSFAHSKNSLTPFFRDACALLVPPFSLSSFFSIRSALLPQKHPGWHALPPLRGSYSRTLFTPTTRNSKKTQPVSLLLSVTWFHSSALFFTLEKIDCLFVATSEKHRGGGAPFSCQSMNGTALRNDDPRLFFFCLFRLWKLSA